jgi:hypothetical protein
VNKNHPFRRTAVNKFFGVKHKIKFSAKLSFQFQKQELIAIYYFDFMVASVNKALS